MESSDIMTINPAWKSNDTINHGTGMAGIAFWNNVQMRLEGTESTPIHHGVESVKILNNEGNQEYNLWADFIRQAVYLVETDHPERTHIYCLATTADDESGVDGTPSSWSSGIDQLIAGEMDSSRLFCISAGNHQIPSKFKGNYLDICSSTSVQSPGQAWNAITVGAMTDLVYEAPNGDYSVAHVGELSPLSPSSVCWNPSRWPIKPEIVCEGGNLMVSGIDYFTHDPVSVLTLRNEFRNGLFTSFAGTSPATAEASFIATEIQSAYPNLRPETVRALLIHSAQWTHGMLQQFKITERSQKTDYSRLIRCCGYGVPDLNRAINTVQNAVNLVIEGTLEPYSQGKYNQMVLLELPWPRTTLLQLENTLVELRITLSYFVEPNPGCRGWKGPYLYPSCGLVFDLNRANENEEDFVGRITKVDTISRQYGGNDHWLLGKKNRDVGSIHSDLWRGTASELATQNMIAVYPTNGWWKTTKAGKKSVQYALIVSLRTEDRNVDLYSEIKQQIEIDSRVTVENRT